MFTRILVATDFGATSDAALQHARAIAGAFDARLHLLHVLPNVFLRAVVGDPHDSETAAASQLLDRFTAEDRHRLRPMPLVERSDDPADAIVHHARTREIDLIVMGTHGRRRMAHALTGSVAEAVVRTAPCPVMTIRQALPTADAGFRRILVATDFSERSDAALACARLMARQFGASLHVLHVLEDLPAESGAFELDAFLRAARERLIRRVMASDVDGLHATTEVVAGATAETIVDYAAGYQFDLIAMGTHGRTGVARLLMGSVAEQVVRSAACPVMTTHAMRDPVSVLVPALRRLRARA